MDDWFIYSLHREVNGPVVYVGKTRRPRRRLKEHRDTFGRAIRMEIIVSGNGPGCNEEEARWIKYFRSLGECSENIADGGGGNAGWHAQSTKDKLSRILKGRIVSDVTRARISAALKGQPRNWTAKGRRSVEKTQFKHGHYKFAELPTDVQEYHRAARKKQWEAVGSETRTRLATERNLGAWRKRSDEERKAIGRRIYETKVNRLSAQRVAEIARENGRKVADQPNIKEKSSALFRGWWASLTPEAKATFVTKRAIAIRAARAKKLAAKNSA